MGASTQHSKVLWALQSQKHYFTVHRGGQILTLAICLELHRFVPGTNDMVLASGDHKLIFHRGDLLFDRGVPRYKRAFTGDHHL